MWCLSPDPNHNKAKVSVMGMTPSMPSTAGEMNQALLQHRLLPSHPCLSAVCCPLGYSYLDVVEQKCACWVKRFSGIITKKKKKILAAFLRTIFIISPEALHLQNLPMHKFSITFRNSNQEAYKISGQSSFVLIAVRSSTLSWHPIKCPATR